MKIYNRKKPEVTVNRWRSAIIIHNIIHGIFIIIFTNISKRRKFTTDNRHKRKIYNREKPMVTVNIGWRSVINIHNIINGIINNNFTNISKQEPSRRSVLKPPPLGCLRIIQ
jgi:hypothetical protein